MNKLMHMNINNEEKKRKTIVVTMFMVTSVLMSLLVSSCSVNEDVPSLESSMEAVAETTVAAQESESLRPLIGASPTPVPTPEPVYVEPLFDETWYNGFVDPRSIRATIVQNPDDINCVVNKYYALPEDYEPSDLVDCEHSMDQQLRAVANDAWNALYADCLEATGQEVYLMSGYRSYSTQRYLFERAVNNRGVAFAVKRNAYQGRSEHQLGLAMDLTPVGYDRLIDEFDETTPGAWINEHCYEYGFIMRYQFEFIDDTGYDREGWHYRYVGVELATYLYEHNMSLEAYWGLTTVETLDE